VRYHTLQVGFFLTLLIGAVLLVGAIVLPYLTPLVFALILAVMFWPLHARLLRGDAPPWLTPLPLPAGFEGVRLYRMR